MDWIQERVKKKDYKGFVGKAESYEAIGKMVFDKLIKFGLSKRYNVLDYGCGSLRVAKHLIPYLYKGRYTGYEPNFWLVECGLVNEIGKEHIENKIPMFYKNFNNIDGQYDFIFAHSVLVHAGTNNIKEILQGVRKLLKENGVFIFNFIEGKDNIKETWSYPSGVRYSKNTMFNYIKEYGYEYEELEKDAHIWLKLKKV